MLSTTKGYRLASNLVFDPDLVTTSSSSHIRNVCILAHVDHGKTTLSDHLISSSGLISKRSAGQIHFLDSRSDEQRRLITMKASCITLRFNPRILIEDETIIHDTEPYWINLIDSPGHVDFSTEVSAAARLCDGALILIDAIEGVCPQTRQVVLRAFAERTKLLLVINKMDRLFTELCLSPTEAYAHLCLILGQVNAMTQQLLIEEAMRSSTLKRNDENSSDIHNGKRQEISPQHFEIDDRLEEEIRFSPEKGNVIFCSSLHAWAFDLPTFAKTLAQKMELPLKAIPKLTSALWGDYYLNPKTKIITSKPHSTTKKPMAVHLVFEQLWKVYACTMHQYDRSLIDKIILGLNLEDQIDEHVLEDGSSAVKAIMSTWLPLSINLLNVVVEKLPSPIAAAEPRLSQLCPGFKQYLNIIDQSSKGKEAFAIETPPQTVERYKVFDALRSCSCGVDDPVVIYAAKFLGADLANLRLTSDKFRGNERISDFVTISRILSGRVTVGTMLYVCGTEFVQQRGLVRSTKNASEYSESNVVVTRIFYLLGQDLIETASVRAGSVVALCLQRFSTEVTAGDSTPTTMPATAISDCDTINDVLAWMMSLKDPHSKRQALKRGVSAGTNRTLLSIDRCITLSNSPYCPPMKTPYSKTSSAIVRVCLEPKDVRDTTILLRGLATLYKADPGVEVDVLDSGEVTLGCSGELHLEKCLNDLQNLYAQIELNVSPPLVAVRESLSFSLPLITPEHSSRQTASVLQALSSTIPFPPWSTLLCTRISTDKHIESHEFLLLNERERYETVIATQSIENVPAAPLSHSQSISQPLGALLQVRSGKGGVIGATSNNHYAFRIRAEPLPGHVLEWLDENSSELEASLDHNNRHTKHSSQQTDDTSTSDDYIGAISSLPKKLEDVWNRDESETSDEYRGLRMQQIHAPKDPSASLNQKSIPGELLGVSLSHGSRNLLFWSVDETVDVNKLGDGHCAASSYSSIPASFKRILPAILSGFELASQAGPLCEEPVIGVAFYIEAVVDNFSSNSLPTDAEKPQTQLSLTPGAPSEDGSSRKDGSAKESGRGTSLSEPYGPISGQVISCIKDCCRRSLLQRGRCRIYEAMHRLELHCEQQVLGRAYGVLSKRRAQIISEVLREGTSLFSIEAYIPVIESFGLALDLRSRASGQVSLHVQFSHWQMVDEDPFPEAMMTEEELEDEGESGSLTLPSNIARRTIYTIRKRKGLLTDEKVVMAATKQRTLTRNK